MAKRFVSRHACRRYTMLRSFGFAYFVFDGWCKHYYMASEYDLAQGLAARLGSAVEVL